MEILIEGFYKIKLTNAQF